MNVTTIVVMMLLMVTAADDEMMTMVTLTHLTATAAIEACRNEDEDAVSYHHNHDHPCHISHGQQHGHQHLCHVLHLQDLHWVTITTTVRATVVMRCSIAGVAGAGATTAVAGRNAAANGEASR